MATVAGHSMRVTRDKVLAINLGRSRCPGDAMSTASATATGRVMQDS